MKQRARARDRVNLTERGVSFNSLVHIKHGSVKVTFPYQTGENYTYEGSVRA